MVRAWERMVILVLGSACAWGQPGRASDVPPAAAAQPPEIQPEGLIQLNVMVTDKKGQPTAGLGPGDFIVLDNGQPEKLVSFHAFRGATVPVVIVLDMLRISDELARAEQRAVEAFLRQNGGRLRQPVTIFSLTNVGMWLVADSSLDGNTLATDMEHDKQVGLVRAVRGAMRGEIPDSLHHTDPASLEALKALGQILTMERRMPGRKLILWMGPGDAEGSGVVAFRQSSTASYFYSICWFSILLRDAQVTLDSFSAGESDPQSQAYLHFVHGVSSIDHADPIYLSRKVLAVQSGGQVMDRSWDLVEEMNQCLRDAGTYYSLSFTAAPAQHDEEYHPIQVQVDRPGLIVRTATGYYDEPYYSDQPPPEVRRLTVAQLDATSATLASESDGEAAKQLTEIQLTERAGDADLARWITKLHGKKAREAIMAVADASAFLDPPPDEITADPPPDDDMQRQIVARAQAYLSETIPKLPNFFAKRTTIYYQETAQFRQGTLNVDYQPLHVVKTRREPVTYRGGEEIGANGGPQAEVISIYS